MPSFFVLFGHKILVLLNEFSKPKIWLITTSNLKNQIEYILDVIEKLDLFFGWGMVVSFPFLANACITLFVLLSYTFYLHLYKYSKVWEDPNGIDISYLI